jgi:hypothetical protein
MRQLNKAMPDNPPRWKSCAPAALLSAPVTHALQAPRNLRKNVQNLFQKTPLYSAKSMIIKGLNRFSKSAEKCAEYIHDQ